MPTLAAAIVTVSRISIWRRSSLVANSCTLLNLPDRGQLTKRNKSYAKPRLGVFVWWDRGHRGFGAMLPLGVEVVHRAVAAADLEQL